MTEVKINRAEWVCGSSNQLEELGGSAMLNGPIVKYGCDDEEPKRNTQPVCPECGSNDIAFNAVALWDPKEHQFVLSFVSISYTCEACGYEDWGAKWDQGGVKWEQVGGSDE
jgi:predicted RNA-binding Zn-ribbon protein involved in translation (DUF1610 family)